MKYTDIKNNTTLVTDWSVYAPYFKKSDFDCKCGCGLNNMKKSTMDALLQARIKSGVPFSINSGCRCIKHNINVGGKPDSSHPDGLAIDISTRQITFKGKYYSSMLLRYQIMKAIMQFFPRCGINFKHQFIHSDNDIKKPLGLFPY